MVCVGDVRWTGVLSQAACIVPNVHLGTWKIVVMKRLNALGISRVMAHYVHGCINRV